MRLQSENVVCQENFVIHRSGVEQPRNDMVIDLRLQGNRVDDPDMDVRAPTSLSNRLSSGPRRCCSGSGLKVCRTD